MSTDKINYLAEYSSEELLVMYENLKLHPLTALLLAQRNIKDINSAKKFLNPNYSSEIGDPFQILGVNEAVKRIVLAIKNNEKICIYSDYDCDGIPGGVLLRTFFNDIGYPVKIYIPHRHNEGYGININSLDKLKKEGVTLIITVDLAITNIIEVDYAKTLGIDVIVTDHHLPLKHLKPEDSKKIEDNDQIKTTKKSKLVEEEANLLLKNAISEIEIQVVPNAYAVINSKQEACDYHDEMLCGCAVAWKLVCAILVTLKKEVEKQENFEKNQPDPSENMDSFGNVLDNVKNLKEGYEKWLLDLVAISTISDMVPLVKENRALAYFGLKVLRQTKRHGLNHIFKEQGISKEFLTEEDVAFTIAPRINAASRMGDPVQAHNMLYEKDNITAQYLVDDLEKLNTNRKSEVKDILSTISFDHAVYKNDVIVVGDISWGPGVLGLIAQNIIDETGKPAFVWGQGEDKITVKGSCRSKGEVSVVALMSKCKELFPETLTFFGGHEQAGGFSSLLHNVSLLSDALNESIKHVSLLEISENKNEVSGNLTLDEINLTTFNAVNALAPFGIGNPKPLFAFVNVKSLSVRWFGKKSEHLEVIYPKSRGEVKAIMFFASRDLEEKAKKLHTLLAHVEKSHFRGKTELRLRIKEVV